MEKDMAGVALKCTLSALNSCVNEKGFLSPDQKQEFMEMFISYYYEKMAEITGAGKGGNA